MTDEERIVEIGKAVFGEGYGGIAIFITRSDFYPVVMIQEKGDPMTIDEAATLAAYLRLGALAMENALATNHKMRSGPFAKAVARIAAKAGRNPKIKATLMPEE